MTDAQKRKKPWLTIVEKSDRSENLQAKTDKSQAKNEKHSKIEKNQVKQLFQYAINIALTEVTVRVMV